MRARFALAVLLCASTARAAPMAEIVCPAGSTSSALWSGLVWQQEVPLRHGGRVAEAARRSVAAIQARINSTPGRLALADGEGGRLSEVDDPSGRVTLPDQDD